MGMVHYQNRQMEAAKGRLQKALQNEGDFYGRDVAIMAGMGLVLLLSFQSRKSDKGEDGGTGSAGDESEHQIQSD